MGWRLYSVMVANLKIVPWHAIELSSLVGLLLNKDTTKINHLKAMVTQHNSAVWPVPYACA